MGERFQWRAQGQCSKGDSCRFSLDPLLASGNSGGSQRRKGRSSSPACHSKAKQTDGEKGDTEENSDKKVRLCVDVKFEITRRVSFGIFPCVWTASLKKSCKCRLRRVEEYVKPNRGRKKVVRKGQLLFCRSLHKWVVYLKILIRESPFYVNQEDWDRNTPSNSPKAPGTESKFGKERVHREVLSQSVHLMSVVLARQNSSTDHMRRPWHQNDALAKQRGIWRKIFTSSRIRTWLRFMFLVKSKVCRRLLLQRDRRARLRSRFTSINAHDEQKKESSSEELWTVKRSWVPTVVLTANGDVHTHEEAQVFVHDLNQFVTVQLLEETQAVLSLDKLCKDHGYSYERVSGQEARLTPNGKVLFMCKTDNFVPLVVPG